MKKTLLALFFISTFSLLQGCAGGLGDNRTIIEQFDDNALSRAALHKVRELHISNDDMRINFLTNSGYLLVVGQVTDQQKKDDIDNKLSTLKEANGVYNQIRISKPIGFAQQTKDSWITAQIKSKFTANDQLNPFQVKVVTENQEVFLAGKVDSNIASIATNIARNVPDVKQVNRAFQLIEEKETK